MQELGPAAPAMEKKQILDFAGKAIQKVMQSELSDANDSDRIWLLRIIHRNYTYYRDLVTFVASSLTGILDVTGVAGPIVSYQDGYGYQVGDYSQNIFRGYCRKLEGVLGNRMPTVAAVPNDPDNEESIQATKSATIASDYIIHECEMRLRTLELIFNLFNFGTIFWKIEWVVDGERYGFDMIPDPSAPPTVESTLGDEGYICPNCTAVTPGTPQQIPSACMQCDAPLGPQNYHPPTPVTIPNPNIPLIPRPKGGLQLKLKNGSEVFVPLESTSVDDPNCCWLREEEDVHKSVALSNAEWGETVQALNKDTAYNDTSDSTSSQYAQQIRSAMASPIGIIRPLRNNQWTIVRTWWKPSMYKMISDEAIRKQLQEQFPKGLMYTSVRGKIVDIVEAELAKDWRECKPEPSCRIMGDPLGNDWIQPQEITNNTLNQANETIERANQPMFADPTRIDTDAFQANRAAPGRIFPAIRPAGGSLQDIIYQPEPVEFSEQIPVFQANVEERAKKISGLLDAIWGGGDSEEPTARQAELKKNAAIQQLQIQWAMIGKSLECVYKQACEKIAQYEEGILLFSKKNQFGKFEKQQVIAKDLKSGLYHFEADEAVPMTWGQQRDLLMWFLDKPAELAQKWGLDDPLNIFTFNKLLGMPGERIPLLDDRDKGMDVISQLLQSKPQPGQPDPQTGQPGDPQPSIAPDWEDNHQFLAQLARAFLTVNASIKTENPDGYQNVVAWGKAHDAMATPPPQPPKTNVSLSVKPTDIGPQATQDALQESGLIKPGTPVELPPPPPLKGTMPPPGMGAAPTGLTQ